MGRDNNRHNIGVTMPQESMQGQFDVPYGLASAKLTAGLTVVTTTAAAYHGISIVAGGTASAKIFVFDNPSATTGNIIDAILVKTADTVWIDRYIPVWAKTGLTIGITGVDAEGAVFYGPKG